MRKLVLLHHSPQEEPLRGISNSDIVYISFHTDNVISYNINPKYKYLKLDNLLQCCKKHDGESIDTVFMKNFSFLKIYIRNILKEILDPLILSGVIEPSSVIVLDNLDRVYGDNVINIIETGKNLSDYIRHEFDMLTDIRIVIKEDEGF